MSVKNQEICDQYHRYCVPLYEPAPDVVFTEAEGVWMRDTEGNKYVDCLAGYSALNQGHSHPDIVHAMLQQARKLSLTTRAFYNDQLGDFLEKLCCLAHMEMGIPMNSGAEAVETALKIARKWGYDRKQITKDRAEIIVCKNNFHGRTLSIVSFSSSDVSRTGFGPLTSGFKMVPFGDIDALRQAITPKTAAFLIEPIQGEAGVIIPPEGYLTAVRERCTENNVLLIMDEIQTGLGRAGSLFAFQQSDAAKPDLLLLGKALSGGLYPISAVLGSRAVMEVMVPGTHGSTYGGNPLAAAIGIAALDVIVGESLPERSKEMGAYFLDELRQLKSPYIRDIRGRGLMMAMDLTPEAGGAKYFCRKLLSLGVVCKDVHDHTIRISPPLVISKAEIDWVVQRFRLVFEMLDGQS